MAQIEIMDAKPAQKDAEQPGDQFLARHIARRHIGSVRRVLLALCGLLPILLVILRLRVLLTVRGLALLAILRLALLAAGLGILVLVRDLPVCLLIVGALLIRLLPLCWLAFRRLIVCGLAVLRLPVRLIRCRLIGRLLPRLLTRLLRIGLLVRPRLARIGITLTVSVLLI